jgi:predicted RNase H-like nuclease (RuvC/YqgF family)
MSAFVYYELQGRISNLERKLSSWVRMVRELREELDYIRARLAVDGHICHVGHELDEIRARLAQLEGAE